MNGTKYKIGHLYGHPVYVEISSNYSNAKQREIATDCEKYFEKSFKNQDFVDMLKEIFKS